MPYAILPGYEKYFKRKCACGGTAQMILDIVQDYIVRCDRCHESTNAYMYDKAAIRAWNHNKCTGPLTLLTDDLEQHLSCVKQIYILKNGFAPINPESFDCDELILVSGEKLIGVECEAVLEFQELSDFDKDAYICRTELTENGLHLEEIRYNEHGCVEGIKYKQGDRFLFLFAQEDDCITVTAEKNDLFQEI